MNSATIAVHWHDDNQPVYSVDFQPGARPAARLATAGGDNNVRIWKVNYGTPNTPAETSVEYRSTLRKHTQAVNAVRFDPTGHVLATAGDDGLLILWTLSDHVVHEFGHQDDDAAESWVVKHVHNTNLEIYDIAWSPDGRYVATGSMDNITKIYNVQLGQKHTELADHAHYVQGVAWDPLNEFLATQSADRSMHVYLLKTDGNSMLVTPTLFFKIVRAELPATKLSTEVVYSLTELLPKLPQAKMCPPAQNFVHNVVSLPPPKSLTSEMLPAVKPAAKRAKRSMGLYHTEALQSFFRRLAFSPDGSLLLTPLGTFKEENDDSVLNTVYIYIRLGLNKPPVCHLPGLAKPAVAIAFSPVLYILSATKPVFSLPHKMVFAVATQDSVIIYDTEHLQPLGMLLNLHYLTITDLRWNTDGQSIMVASAEGFCSVIQFEPGLFGKPIDAPEPASVEEATKTIKNEVTKNNTIKNEDTTTDKVTSDKATADKATTGKATTDKTTTETTTDKTTSDDSSTKAKSTEKEPPIKPETITISEPAPKEVPQAQPLGVLSHIAQFMANPVILPAQPEPQPATQPEATAKQPKKRRITPTLVQK